MKRLSTELRQEQIIDEAISLIHNNGFSSLSIRELAYKVGISEAAIYRHFKSKDEIINGIFRRIQSLSKELFFELNSINHPDKKLKAFILFHMNLFTQHPELVSILMSEEIFEHNSSYSEVLKSTIKNRHAALIKIIDDGVKNQIFIGVDSDTLSAMIQGFIRLTLLKWKSSKNKFSLLETGEKFFKTLQTLLNKKQKHS
ncbi:MAG: TetR/AcrR family transcriptional regulator [Bacteroidetes bacterium]|nr:TetR/AcrR family transcriptional regulator [Bacteroidota bacterium]